MEGLANPPLRITAACWRALGPPQQPSAYGLTLDQGQTELVALLEHSGARALRAAGLPPPGRTPLPHVTLLRLRRRERGQCWGPMQAWMASAPLPPQALSLERLELWTWAEDRRLGLFRQVRCRALNEEAAEQPWQPTGVPIRLENRPAMLPASKPPDSPIRRFHGATGAGGSRNSKLASLGRLFRQMHRLATASGNDTQMEVADDHNVCCQA